MLCKIAPQTASPLPASQASLKKPPPQSSPWHEPGVPRVLSLFPGTCILKLPRGSAPQPPHSCCPFTACWTQRWLPFQLCAETHVTTERWPCKGLVCGAVQRADVYQSSTPVQPVNMPSPLRLKRPLQALPIHPPCDFCTTCWFCQGHLGHLLFRVSCSSKLHSLPCFVCQRPALTLPAHGSPASSPHTGRQLRHLVGGDAPGTTEPHSIPASIPHHPCIHQ